MDIRPLTDAYAVSPQIAPEDLPAVKAAGFTTVICNRPDGEIPPDLHAAVMAEAAAAAGLGFVINPVVHGALTQDTVDTQAEVLRRDGEKVLAYCASGNRSAIVWSLIMAPDLGADGVLAATRAAGYDHSPFRPQFAALAGG